MGDGGWGMGGIVRLILGFGQDCRVLSELRNCIGRCAGNREYEGVGAEMGSVRKGPEKKRESGRGTHITQVAATLFRAEPIAAPGKNVLQ